VDSEVVCLGGVPIDDYESWYGDLPEGLHSDKPVLCVHELRIYTRGMRLIAHLESIGPKLTPLKTVKL
jgi:hypothetical protein